MLYRITLAAAIVLVFVAGLAARRRLDDARRPEASPGWQCRRIVSMAPSVTETLYALGLGDRVIGVTRDCRYPPEVEAVKKAGGEVGGYFDPNFEAIVGLRPDLAVLLVEQSNWLPAFERLGIETLVVNHQTTDGIIASFGQIGRVCGRGPEGRRMERDFRRRIQNLREKTRRLDRPRVLFVTGRTYGCGQPVGLFVAADDDYLDTIIQWAGGQNAYRRRGVRYPVVSAESVLWLDPDVIVDLVPPEKLRQLGREKILADWDVLENAKAVKNHRVLVPDRDYAYIPGPRFLQLVECLAESLHPEVQWDE